MTVSVFAVDGRPVRLSRLRACLAAHPKIDFRGAAASLGEAARQIAADPPEAVVLGGELTELSGFAAFAETLRGHGVVMIPVWVFPFNRVEVEALFGAEPPAGIADSVPEGDTAFLVETIVAAVLRAHLENGRPGRRSVSAPAPEQEPPPILIGASTGGVEALHAVLGAFPPDGPPVLVVQHMRPQFTASFVEGLNRACRAEVVQAREGAPLTRGRIFVAPGNGTHLALAGGAAPHCRLLAEPPVSGHRPSVDVLFRSGAGLPRPPVAALLTGMGRDGAEGLLAIRRRGGHTIVQSRETCAVWGMPRAAEDCGAAVEVLPLERIGAALLRAAAQQRSAPGQRSAG